MISIVLAITALIAWLNARFLKLPSTIGVMAAALMLSAAALLLDRLGLDAPHAFGAKLLGTFDFSEVLMQGMLSVLLFAGALQVDLRELAAYRWQIALLAFGGTVAAALLVGFGLHAILPYVGLPLPLGYCLVFGALIAPTDPISVTGLLRKLGAPHNLETVISGESLFNDGVGIVVFVVMAELAASHQVPAAGDVVLLLLREAGGGILFGVALGFVSYILLASIDSYQEEVLITVATVLGGYALAHRLGVSGPLAMVATGILIGNLGRQHAMSSKTEEHVDQFWELLDGIFNAILFVLIGFEAMVLPLSATLLAGGAAAIIVTLVARLLTAGLPVAWFQRHGGLPKGAWQVLTWGGLRGGISVALALSLPASPYRDILVTVTYEVVVFSILVQGMTTGPLVRRLVPCTG
ncbi:cation:proton antiporter [Massilia rhizosphaerae]|uniref:cation:proton antiporter n=1 Tax=Massilia rhizosphaerae TaxID=2784389 RepID=UPI00351D457D